MYPRSTLRTQFALAASLLSILAFCTKAIGAQAEAADTQQASRKLTRAERAAGWHWIFDGTSTDALRGYRKQGFPEKGWVIEDGTLRHVQGGGGGDVMTRRAYRNFELELEWKVGAGANSGIIYKIGESEGASYMTGLEYQILDDAKHKGAQGKAIGAGGLYALYTPKNKQLFGAGMWNRARIVCRGPHVEHWLNGAKILECTIGSDDWNARIAKSKFRKWKRFGTVQRGHIAFQDHGNDVWFRNVRIRELEPERARHGEEVRLFDRRSTAAWDHHLVGNAAFADVWSLDPDGVLVCKGKPRGYLATKRSFGNFILEVDWRWPDDKKPGNSGVLLRKQGDDKVWPRSIEAQLQSGRAGDFWNIEEMVMQTDKRRLRGRNTQKSHGNEKPIGAWNRYRILCDGPWVRLLVNGEVLNEAWGTELLSGPICLQSEGAEIHFGRVVVTPLRD